MANQKILHCSAVIFAFLTLFNPAAQGQEPSKPAITPAKRALIAEFLDITQTRKVSVEVYRGMMEQQRQMTRDTITQSMETKPEFNELSPENKERVRKEILDNSDRAAQRVHEMLEARLDFPTLIEDISYQLYDKYFTEDEIKDLLTFYRSPAGKKFIEVGPKLFSESMELARVSIMPIMREVIEIMAKEESDRLNRELEAIENEAPPAKPRPTKRRSGKARKP
jgi:hypothetical protein